MYGYCQPIAAMMPLTERQSAILEFIHESLDSTGIPPSRADIARRFGFRTRSAADDHLRALAAKGYLALVPGRARGIRLCDSAKRVLAHRQALPLVGRIAAGTPITAAGNIETWLQIDPGLFRPRADFLHRVAGHSMYEAGILDGDLVGIHAQPIADNGRIVAAAIPDPQTGETLITLKRYIRRGAKVILEPANRAPTYRPIEIDLASADPASQEAAAIRIVGLYAGLIRTPR